MDWASRYGHITVLDWWKSSGLECKWSENAMDGASSEGHVAVLDWWFNSGLELKFSHLSLRHASVRNWLDDHGFTWYGYIRNFIRDRVSLKKKDD
jgi:hypothetical protein